MPTPVWTKEFAIRVRAAQRTQNYLFLNNPNWDRGGRYNLQRLETNSSSIQRKRSIMPAIARECPECGKRLRVGEKLLGKKIRCPGCQATISFTAESVEAGESQEFMDALPFEDDESEKEPPFESENQKEPDEDRSIDAEAGAAASKGLFHQTLALYIIIGVYALTFCIPIGPFLVNLESDALEILVNVLYLIALVAAYIPYLIGRWKFSSALRGSSAANSAFVAATFSAGPILVLLGRLPILLANLIINPHFAEQIPIAVIVVSSLFEGVGLLAIIVAEVFFAVSLLRILTILKANRLRVWPKIHLIVAASLFVVSLIGGGLYGIFDAWTHKSSSITTGQGALLALMLGIMVLVFAGGLAFLIDYLVMLLKIRSVIELRSAAPGYLEK